MTKGSLLRRLRERLTDPKVSPTGVLVAAYLVGISVNLLSSQLEKRWSGIVLALGLGIPGVLFFLIAGPVLVRRLRGEHVEPTVSFGPARPRKGLIVLVSRPPGDATAKKAITHHHSQLEKVWLLCSKAGSEPAARELIQHFAAKEILRPDQMELVVLAPDEFRDPERVKEAIERIYEALPAEVAEGDVVIDITGGVKLTTAGAFLAGLPPGRHLQYVPAQEVDASGRALVADDPVEVRVDYSVTKAVPR